MTGHGAIWGRLSGQLRRVDAHLRPEGAGGAARWLIPASTFAAIVALFFWLGAVSGVWAAEYIPTGLVIGSVIAGLVVACMEPGSDPPLDAGDGNGGWGGGPPPEPAPGDPSIWVRLLADADLPLLGWPERDPAPATASPATAGVRLPG